jgi:hypothetical protein
MLAGGMWRRWVIALFVVLCFGTIAFANRPEELALAVDRRLDQSLSPLGAWRVRYASWLVQRYAHLVGLDNRWEMFGRQSRFNWHYVLRGRYGDAGEHALPLPLQTGRTSFEDLVLDFKEPKFHLNLYPDQPRRERYAQYLCRRFPSRGGRRIDAIVFEIRWQELRSRAEASASGEHLAAIEYSRPLDVFPCDRTKHAPS